MTLARARGRDLSGSSSGSSLNGKRLSQDLNELINDQAMYIGDQANTDGIPEPGMLIGKNTVVTPKQDGSRLDVLIIECSKIKNCLINRLTCINNKID